MKRIQIPLFWKFTFAIILIVAFFGAVNLYFINYSTYKSFENELNRHGFVTGRNLAMQSVDFILYEDIISLNKNVTELKNIDPGIAYVFITDTENKVIAHSFDSYVPKGLINVNLPGVDKEKVALFFEKDSKRNIHDYLVPILKGELGNVRIGLFEDVFFSNFKATSRFFLIMVIVFLFLGLLGAFIFSHIITLPIKNIIKKAELIQLDKTEEVLIILPEKIENKYILYFSDELNILTEKFNEMILRLHNALNELNLAQKTLVQTEKMSAIGTLSAGIAHEINNPIAGIKNCLRRIEDSPNNLEQQKKYIELMKGAVNKIELVVTGLLNFSRKHNLIFENQNFISIIESVLLLSSFELKKSKISVVKDFAPENRFISGSKNHLEQIVLNLLINSIDAINEKKLSEPDLSGEILLKIVHLEEFSKFSIEDNGIGIPPEKTKFLFDPFFTLKKIKQGTGLGLSVTYNIVKQHNGKIEVSPKDGGGIKFSVYLPYKN